MAPPKRRRSTVYVVSVGAHLLLGLGLAFIPKQKLREVVGIALAESKPPEAKPKPPPPVRDEPAKARPARSPNSNARAAARPAVEPASSEPARTEAFTDLGISLDASAAGGIAVPVAAKPTLNTAPVVPAVVHKPKVLAARLAEPECSEALVKARPERVVQAEYTDSARAARVEGRVRLELSLNERGEIQDVRVLRGLGYGLDEAALAAARRMRFRPATRCGKPQGGPFILSMRFLLGA
ncbi:MAG TPA: TonB family protein [Polyangiaceae bacterium]|nr:TonB family protein [Polyangiaceae bacterium]